MKVNRQGILKVVILLIFWIYFIFVNSPFDLNKGTDYEVTETQNTNGVVGEITKDVSISRKFLASENNFQGLAVLCANYLRNNTSTIKVSLVDLDSGKLLFENLISVDDIEDNKYYYIQFDRQKNSKNCEYELKIQGIDGEEGNAITVYSGEGTNNFAEANINGQKIGQSICLKTIYFSMKLQIYKMLVYIVLIICSLFFVLKFKKADENTFLKMAIFIGTLVVVVNPFYHPIDESTHFFRSFMISQGDFKDEINSGVIGGEVPSNYRNIVDEERLSLKTYFSYPKIWNQKLSKQKSFYVNPYMSSVTPINHSIAAVGILIGRVLHLPVVLIIILGRLTDLIFYSIFSYYAIKKSRFYKSFYFMIATLPICFGLAGSYSIDPVLISASLLFSSICLRHYFEKDIEMTRKEKIALIICAIFIASVKYLVYTPILLLFLLVPRKKFTKKEYMCEWVAAIIVVILMAISQILLLKQFPFTEDRNGDVDVMRQVQYIIHNLGTTIRNFVSYFVNNVLHHIEGLGGPGCSSVLSSLIGIFVVFGAFLAPDKYQYNKNEKNKCCILLLLIFLVSYGLTIASLYVGFTPVGKFSVDGLQTRYLIPVLLFIMIPISMFDVKNRIANYEEKVAFIMNIGLIDMLANILLNVF